MSGFLDALKEQRWDDHRFYHQSRINQSLHLVSACCFLASYVLLLSDPALAVLVGWVLAMVTRQAGHFFFEPHGFDEVNGVSNQHKEAIKVGYNIKRKIVLLSIWALAPVALLIDPTFFGAFTPHADLWSFADNMALMWLVIAGAALLCRTVQLFFVRDVQTGLVWFVKILTDPFHDVALYYKSPLHLLRGELLDPIQPRQQPHG